ncbi:MAG: ferritin family protein [Selenomonadaceae bacterium]
MNNDLQFIIDMELEGEAYYRRQAELNPNTPITAVCNMLAAEEKRHAMIVTSRLNGFPYQLLETNISATGRSVFAGAADLGSDGTSRLSQTEFYAIAAQKEQDSINLYTSCLEKAENEAERELFAYLVGQEKQHFTLLDELAALLRQADEWVEDAEFGNRKEY